MGGDGGEGAAGLRGSAHLAGRPLLWPQVTVALSYDCRLYGLGSHYLCKRRAGLRLAALESPLVSTPRLASPVSTASLDSLEPSSGRPIHALRGAGLRSAPLLMRGTGASPSLCQVLASLSPCQALASLPPLPDAGFSLSLSGACEMLALEALSLSRHWSLVTRDTGGR